MPTADEIRAGQREMWGKFSAGWEKWDDVVLNTIGEVGEAMIGALDIADDQQHLEVAAGTGEPGITIAARTPQGHVTLTDLSPEMLAAAQRRATAQGLTNVSFQECGAEDLPFADGTFDSVGCRFGFMFVPDVSKALSEFARVLKPGGRACVAVWEGPEVNPWATVPGAAIASEVEMPAADPDAPGMYRWAQPGAISERFRDAGLKDVREWDVPALMVTDSPEQYWHLVQELTAPVVAALNQVDDAARERITSKVIESAKAYESDGKIRLPGMARCIVGTK
jgi:ubiquinone/menaquinone biosynthesis C-methylase UbiE